MEEDEDGIVVAAVTSTIIIILLAMVAAEDHEVEVASEAGAVVTIINRRKIGSKWPKNLHDLLLKIRRSMEVRGWRNVELN